jgi:hypothetical protein
MGKSLASLLRKTAIKTALISSIALPLAFGSCKPEPKNYAPEAHLEVSPTNGDSPLKVSIKLTGSDLDGIDDIKEYKLTIDSKVIKKNTPLDTIIKFRNSGESDILYNILGEVTDSENQIGKSYDVIRVLPGKINLFIHPNDSTDNWYGSGKVILGENGNKEPINKKDLDRFVEVTSGTFSDPSDTRLYDRMDVNGDGTPNNDDLQLLAKKLNGTILYLPGEWNLLLTWAEREDWLRKMFAIDKTNEILNPEFVCFHFMYQTIINFHGYGDQKDISNILRDYPFDFSNNCRFNIPVLELTLVADNSGHGMNAVVLGDDASIFEDLGRIEPMNDSINPKIKPPYNINSKIYIRGPPTIDMTPGIWQTEYITYEIKNNIPTLTGINPRLITQREK